MNIEKLAAEEDPTMADPAEIARGLSEAQKRWVIARQQPSGPGKWPVQNKLVSKGLATYFPWEWTELGLAVREHLKGQQP